MSDVVKCDRAGCTLPAKWNVGLKLWAPNRRGSPAEGATSLKVCYRCRHEVTIDDMLTAEGWGQICSGFRKIGKAEPDRRLAELIFFQLDDPVVRRLRDLTK